MINKDKYEDIELLNAAKLISEYCHSQQECNKCIFFNNEYYVCPKCLLAYDNPTEWQV